MKNKEKMTPKRGRVCDMVLYETRSNTIHNPQAQHTLKKHQVARFLRIEGTVPFSKHWETATGTKKPGKMKCEKPRQNLC